MHVYRIQKARLKFDTQDSVEKPIVPFGGSSVQCGSSILITVERDSLVVELVY